MEIKLLRAILKKTNKNSVRNTDIKSEVGVDQIKNDIQKSRLRGFGLVVLMTEVRLRKKMQHTEMQKKR